MSVSAEPPNSFCAKLLTNAQPILGRFSCLIQVVSFKLLGGKLTLWFALVTTDSHRRDKSAPFSVLLACFRLSPVFVFCGAGDRSEERRVGTNGRSIFW